MFIDFNPRIIGAHATVIEAITGVRNGCFSLAVVKNNMKSLLMYNRFGQLSYEVNRHKGLNYGVSLKDGACLIGQIIKDDNHQPHIEGMAYLGKVLPFDDAEVFFNDWFVLKHMGTNKLYHANFSVMAQGFSKAKVFKCGYALCFDDATSWQLFSPDGCFLREIHQVEDFIGNGNVLTKSDKGNLKLENFAGQPFDFKPIIGFKKYNDNCFVLTTADGLSRMYDCDALPISVETRDAQFLPDGCFVQFEYGGKLISSIYRPHGILDKRPIFHFETTENYYLISAEFEKERLFDARGKELGRDFTLIKNAENFALFEHEGNIKLFNQYGLVFTFNQAE